MSSTESRGYSFTGVKTASYSKLSVPGYTAINYRYVSRKLDPSLYRIILLNVLTENSSTFFRTKASAADQASMRAQLLAKEGKDGAVAVGKRLASDSALEGGT